MLVRMARVHVIGYRPRLAATLDLLYGLRVMQVIDVGAEQELGLRPLPVDRARSEELGALRTRIDAMLALVPGRAAAAPERRFGPEGLATVEQDLAELEGPVRERVQLLDDLRAERAALPRHVASLTSLLGLVPEIVELRTYDSAILMLERRHAHLLDLLAQELAECAGSRFEVASVPVDADTVGALLVFPRSASERVDAWLGRERVSRLRMPSRFAGVPIRDAIAELEERAGVLDERIASEERALGDLLAPHLPTWAAARAFVEGELERLRAVEAAGALGHTFVVAGWAPQRELSRLRRVLAERVGDDVVVSELPIGREEWDRVPVLMSNPAPVRPFEFLVRMLGLPRYGTIDPTILMAVFLPLFFGVMLGDVAYALVLGALILAARRRLGARSAVWRDLSNVLLLGSAWGLVWGVVFGEFLGGVGRRLGMHPLWIDREQALEALLLFAVGVGVAHVLLGLVIGIWVSWRTRHRADLLEKVGLVVVLSALFLVAGIVAGRLPGRLLTPAVAAGVVGLAAMIRAGGPMGWVMGPLEVLGLMGNVLSYLRIGAIGLASAYLARVANEMAGVAGPVWLGVLVAVLFHALNLALGTFSPMIQALRLHYVEFFGKFHQVGGGAFEPLGAGHASSAS